MKTTETAFFRINDQTSSTKRHVAVKSEGDDGLAIDIADHSTKTSAEGFDDAVLYLEFQDGKPILRVWADINNEEPTHVIDLSGAHISRRLTRFRGHLYFIEDDGKGKKVHIAEFSALAANAQELERSELDELWDSRLDAASCIPHFEYEVVS